MTTITQAEAAMHTDVEKVALVLLANDDCWNDLPWNGLPNRVKKMFLRSAAAAMAAGAHLNTGTPT
jgi:hypothetical protein